MYCTANAYGANVTNKHSNRQFQMFVNNFISIVRKR